MKKDLKQLEKREREETRQIGNAIRVARQAKGIYLGSLAAQVGISANYLGRIERGDTRLSAPVAAKVQEILGISITCTLCGATQVTNTTSATVQAAINGEPHGV